MGILGPSNALIFVPHTNWKHCLQSYILHDSKQKLNKVAFYVKLCIYIISIIIIFNYYYFDYRLYIIVKKNDIYYLIIIMCLLSRLVNLVIGRSGDLLFDNIKMS